MIFKNDFLKIFLKNLKVNFLLYLFQQMWALIFVYFWPRAKIQKNLIHIYQLRDRQSYEQTDKKQASYQTTILQAGPKNEVDNDCFGRDCFHLNLRAIASSPFLRKFLNVLMQQYELF